VLARIADRILVAFPGTLARAHWSGNPVASAIAAVAPPEQRYPGRSGRLRILVVGGSLGARVFNQVLPQALGLMPASSRPAIVHQSGRTHIAELRANYAAAAVDADAVDFIDDMAAAYAEADLVIARAGAMTVSEIACVGVASMLVPFPHAVDDHQTGNARFLSSADAAMLIPQDGFTAAALARLLSDLKREALAAMAGRARALGKPDAAGTVADACESVARVAAVAT
jgi:UDP-N-acetylglucosamine--N-acetylmuramyl-(pentapeptide) pyrophosphoryl-undecaprenol N-acetylglucosamine transferase